MSAVLQDDASTIKKLLDNFDKPMVLCKECGDYTEDTGNHLIKCDSCKEVLIYREPVSSKCFVCKSSLCNCKEVAASEFE